LDRIPQMTNGQKPEFQKVDLLDFPALCQFFEKAPKFDACIHFAGLKAVGESVDQPLRYHRNNVAGTLNLLELLEKYDCRNVVFSSSATVYGTPVKLPITEDHPLSATNPYGRTKLIIEDIFRDLNQGKTKWRIVLLRYFNPIGSHPSGLIGEDPSEIPNNIGPYIAQVAVGRRPHLNIFGGDYDTPDGTGVRDYIHVVDLARGHLAALTFGIFGTGMKSLCECYNLGTGGGYSVFQLLVAFGKAAKKTLKYQIVDRRPGDVASCYSDCSKALRDLQWRATLSLDEACIDHINWQTKNPNGFN